MVDSFKLETVSKSQGNEDSAKESLLIDLSVTEGNYDESKGKQEKFSDVRSLTLPLTHTLT